MAWSIFRQGGGPGAALTWAVDLLGDLGAPLTPGNEQMVYDWEVSEGGGGQYNPLNQGTDPGNPKLTSSGNQYGGGAANYVSWSAGLKGAADYLQMPQFAPIADALRSNNPSQARSDLIASPWAASHYGGGSSFSSEPVPGKPSALPASGGTVSTTAPTGATGAIDSLTGGLTSLTSGLKTAAIVVPVVIGGAALIVWGVARMTNIKTRRMTAGIGA